MAAYSGYDHRSYDHCRLAWIMLIRPEIAADSEAISHVQSQALGAKEAALVEALREHDKVILSLVAVVDEQTVGHILFSPVVIETAKGPSAAVGLGPMGILPQFQRRGIGSALVRAGLDELRKMSHEVVVVLGHPTFYPRFGFRPSVAYGIRSQYHVPDEVFMTVELAPGALTDKAGTVVYASEFRSLE